MTVVLSICLICLEIWVVIPHSIFLLRIAVWSLLHFYMHFRGFLKSMWRMSRELWFGLHWLCKLLLAGWLFSQYWFYQPANVGGRSFHLLVPSSFNVLTAEAFSLLDRFILSFGLLCHCFEATVSLMGLFPWSPSRGLCRWYREQRWASVSWFLCPATLLKLLITSRNVPVWFWGSPVSNGVPSAHRGNWASFPVNVPVISFSWLCSRQGTKHRTEKDQTQWTVLSRS